MVIRIFNSNLDGKNHIQTYGNYFPEEKPRKFTDEQEYQMQKSRILTRAVKNISGSVQNKTIRGELRLLSLDCPTNKHVLISLPGLLKDSR